MARTTPVSNGWIGLVRPLGNDLARRDGDDVDRARRRPDQRQAEQGDDASRDRRGRSARRRLDDLECRRQERELVPVAALCGGNRITIFGLVACS